MARKKDFDEDELLEKAVNIFWGKGYCATSAQDLGGWPGHQPLQSVQYLYR
jgi:hypothetical protein